MIQCHESEGSVRDYIDSRDNAASVHTVELDDGHLPESFQSEAATTTRPLTKLVWTERSSMIALAIHDDAVEPSIVNALYQHTIQEKQPWGTYITVQQVKDYWKKEQLQQQPHYNEAVSGDAMSQADPSNLDYLALRAVEALFRHAMASSSSEQTQAYHFQQQSASESTSRNDKQQQSLWSSSDFELAHGVAVWALGSSVGSQVPYHIDYAEQIRYESNVMVIPLLAGTLHCTPHAIQGGDFCAYVGANPIDHYQTHGYKGVKSGMDSDSMLQADADTWVRVPYQFNRLIVQTGPLPHLSTKVTAVANEQDCKRVMVGFNVFCNVYGPRVALAPEHSKAFRRRVKVQRLLLQNNKQERKDKMSVSDIQANPSLSKFLIWAKRQQIKQEFRQAQAELDDAIYTILKQDQQVSVGSLLDRLGSVLARVDQNNRFSWPRCRDDIHVHLHRRWKDGTLCLVGTVEKEEDDDEQNGKTLLISVDCILALAKT